MLNEANHYSRKQILLVCIVLTLATLAVFGQVQYFDFINLDDEVYVTESVHVQTGMTLEGVRWAFGTMNAGFWHPLTWLSLMLDYEIYGLNPGGYHMTNLILHILSALLLFGLFHHMTGALWRSAFIAALFALHPLRVESVAWIAERKDVLSAFFWMLTLCFYVHYTEKPAIQRYLLVCLFFACSFMSKSIAVTLPVLMILLDYWPLKRFQQQQGHFIVWQLREKGLLFLLSAVFSILAIFAHHELPLQNWNYTWNTRIINAWIVFIIYLQKILWPFNLSLGYPFFGETPAWQALSSVLLIIAISGASILAGKKRPFLLVGWFWYAIAILPVIGIIPVGNNAMADRYIYLPSVGISIMIVWGISSLIKSEKMKKRILLPAGLAVTVIMAVLTWQQCSYWKNSFTLCSHAVLVTKDNFLAHTNLGIALFEKGNFADAVEHYNEAIRLNPDYSYPYHSRGIVYRAQGQYQPAIEDFNSAIRINPDFAQFYYNRGSTYYDIGRYQIAIEDFNEAARLQPDFANAYLGRGAAYINQGKTEEGCTDAQKACALGNCQLLMSARGLGFCR